MLVAIFIKSNSNMSVLLSQFMPKTLAFPTDFFVGPNVSIANDTSSLLASHDNLDSSLS